MKSPPELWELLEDELQLRDWSARLCKGADQVEILDSEKGRTMVWRCDGVRSATFEVSLGEKGWGTQVAIWAEAEDGLRKRVLDEVLDELAEPQRRPFSTA